MIASSSAPSDSTVRALIDWYRGSGRDLPWRQTRDPYPIWISEIMLQQTQVATVLPRYRLWLQRFPTLPQLAASSEESVMQLWQGLGYYRRARLLHAAAQQIAEQHAGRFPADFAAIHALPGIGRSTAGAIASFCFAARTPVLDGNVKRVLQRWQGAAASERQLWQSAQAAIDAAVDPGEWNQAMMELGATCCAPRRPDCAACPVAAGCRSAFTATMPETASTPARSSVRECHWQVQLHRRDAGLWLVRRPDGGIWGGLWSPPIIELNEAPDTAPLYSHRLTHRLLHLHAHECAESPAGEGVWCPNVGSMPLPTGIRRLLQRVEGPETETD